MQNSQLQPVDQRALDSIHGWLSTAAQTLTSFFISLQRKQGYVTGVLELGVFRGKHLSFLNHCVRGLGVPVVGVDAFLADSKTLLAIEDRECVQRSILESISSVSDDVANVSLIASYTRDVDVARLLEIAPSGFSFISVDAGHDAADVTIDMAIAERALSEKGIAAIDDVYNETTPGVGAGFFQYFYESGASDLAAFATGGNKVYMCRPRMHAYYLEAALDLAQRAESQFPAIAATTERLRDNRKSRWSPRLLESEIVPFLYGLPPGRVRWVSRIAGLLRMAMDGSDGPRPIVKT